MNKPSERSLANLGHNTAAGALVSIVLPTHNRPEMLLRALRSVVSQTYDNIEVIVVDDHSDRPAQEVVDTIGDSRIRCIRNEQCVGGSMARNVGIGHAKGEWVAFLDDDDEFLPEKIAHQVRCAATSDVSCLAVIYCNTVVVDDHGRFCRYGAVGPKGNALREHLLRNVAPLPTAMVKRKVLLEVGGFKDLICGQEYELWLRILERGYGVDYCPEPLLRVHEHSGARISNAGRVVEGLVRLHAIKRQYCQGLSKREMKEILHREQLVVYHAQLQGGGWLRASKAFLRAFSMHPLSLLNCVELIGLLGGYRLMVRIKAVIHSRLRTGPGLAE